MSYLGTQEPANDEFDGCRLPALVACRNVRTKWTKSAKTADPRPRRVSLAKKCAKCAKKAFLNRRSPLPSCHFSVCYNQVISLQALMFSRWWRHLHGQSPGGTTVHARVGVVAGWEKIKGLSPERPSHDKTSSSPSDLPKHPQQISSPELINPLLRIAAPQHSIGNHRQVANIPHPTRQRWSTIKVSADRHMILPH
jgi:hypothetical protein